jgi:hypothetical protein
MAKPGINPVPRSEFERIAREAGCTLTPMASCIKVQKGKSQNRLYITNPTQCARVDISNFDHPDTEIVRNLGGESFGKVHQMLRFDRPVESILAAFRLLCEGLDTFQSHPKKDRPRPAGFKGSRRKGPQPGPSVEVKAEETPAQHAERLIEHYNKIKRYSERTGIPISPKTVAEMQAKVQELGFSLEV